VKLIVRHVLSKFPSFYRTPSCATKHVVIGAKVHFYVVVEKILYLKIYYIIGKHLLCIFDNT
jgi:hypothetical protein